MEAVKERLRERTLDVLDWIDYRPDPHWWQYLVVPAAIGAAYYFTPMNLWPFILAITIVATIVALVAGAAALVAIVAWRAVRDIIGSMLRKRRPVRPYGPRILIGHYN